MFSNSVLGITQEVKARRELARLQVLTEPEATVIRAGSQITIDIEQIVMDDVVLFHTGGQLPVDGKVIAATGLLLDESQLTGESLPMPKDSGDTALSGSFVVAGVGRMRTTQSASAAVAMVPDGLVLLTSLAFVAGTLELTRRNALASQLSTVELLARVDVLCLDKTGTITTGAITYGTTHSLSGRSEPDVHETLAAMAAADEAPNAAMSAIAAVVGSSPGWTTQVIEPFSSDSRHWPSSNSRTKSGPTRPTP